MVEAPPKRESNTSRPLKQALGNAILALVYYGLIVTTGLILVKLLRRDPLGERRIKKSYWVTRNEPQTRPSTKQSGGVSA